MSGFIGRRARLSWVLTTLVLLVAAFFLTTLKANGLSIADAFTSTPKSVTGQQILQQHFPGGSGNPAVIIANADQADAVVAAAEKVDGVTGVVPYTGSLQPGAPPKVVDGLVLLEATLAPHAIHDLHLLRTPGDRTQEPLPPRTCFVDISRLHQRHQGEGRVAQPAIPVIPVAHAAELLG